MAETKRLRSDAQRNRDALIRCAREIFGAGDEQVRFDDFARLACVGTGTLYRHFPTRESLALAVLEEETARLCATASELQARLPPAQALATFLRRFVEHIDENQRLARRLAALVATARGDTAPNGRTLDQAVAELLAAAVHEGAIRDDVSAGALMMALHGLSAAHAQPDWRANADEVITVLLDGLSLPARTTGSA